MAYIMTFREISHKFLNCSDISLFENIYIAQSKHSFTENDWEYALWVKSTQRQPQRTMLPRDKRPCTRVDIVHTIF